MKFLVLSVGRPKAGAVADAIDDFEKRAARYWPLEFVQVRAESGASRTPDEVRRREGARLLEQVRGDLAVLDETGTAESSRRFADRLQAARERGTDMTFAIGGAFGLEEAVRQRARVRIAVAPWTLSHDLARLVLAEQLYRAGTIIRGEPYHK